MTRNNMIAALLGSFALCVTGAAQSPNLVRIVRLTVKADRVDEWMDAQKTLNAAYKKAGVWRTVYRTVYGNTLEFVVASPVDSYASLDDAGPLFGGSYGFDIMRKGGMPETQIARLSARTQQCMESRQVSIERPFAPAQISTPGAPMPALIRVARTRVRPGMVDQYLELLKNEFTPAVKRVGVSRVRVRRVEIGGNREEVTLSYGIQKMGELDGELHLARALGPDGYKKYLEKLYNLIVSRESVIRAYQPEFSNPPKE